MLMWGWGKITGLKNPTEFRLDAVAGDHLTTSKVSGSSIEEIVERAATRFGIQFKEIKLIAIEGNGIVVTIHGDNPDA